jgi:hypothetical protein
VEYGNLDAGHQLLITPRQSPTLGESHLPLNVEVKVRGLGTAPTTPGIHAQHGKGKGKKSVSRYLGMM